LTRT